MSNVVTVKAHNRFASGRTTHLEINGQDVSASCCAFTIRASVDEVVSAHVEFLARDGFDIELPAVLEPVFVVMPGYVLIEEDGADGARRFRTKKEPVTE